MPRNIYDNALAIQAGACNPTAIAGEVHQALLQLSHAGADTNTLCTNPAVRLMVHQLGYLVNVRMLDDSAIDYARTDAKCRELAENYAE